MTTVRQTNWSPVNFSPRSKWRPTKNCVHKARDIGHSAANTTTLGNGTASKNGWLIGFSRDHSHQRNCGPRWSKIS